MKTCPLCESKLTYKEHIKKEFIYKKHKKDIFDSGLYCEECNELFMNPNDLDKNDEVIKEFKKEVDHLLSTIQVKKIRKKIDLTQKEASELFGGGIRAFHKYETGLNTQSKPLDILLRLIDNGKISINDVREVVSL